MDAELRSKAKVLSKGNYFEDFCEGQSFDHHWGRTVGESDNLLFSTLTLHYNPAYFNAEYARSNGHAGMVVAPLLAFNIVFGLSVEDLSEIGGPFLGVDNLIFRKSVMPGDTLTAASQVVSKRLSNNRPGYGIVTWQTRGMNQHGDAVLDFQRTNLVRTRP